MKRLVIAGAALALGLGVLATQTIGAGAQSAVKPLPSTTLTGVTITCTNVSGYITENPGLTNASTPGGASVKWKLKAVATGCNSPINSAGVVSVTIAGAIITEKGFIRDPSAASTCAAALGAPGTFGGMTGSKIQWISTPAVASTILPPGFLGAPATIDSVGLEIHWPIAPGTSFDLGGDYPTVTPCPAGPLSSTFNSFGTPSTHTPPFLATL